MGAQAVWWLIFAVGGLATFADVVYVQGSTWGQPSRARIATKVRARDQERPPSRRKGRNSSRDAEARKLTVDLKEAQSADEFLNVLGKAVNRPIFNYFHASCAYHRLATWKRRGTLAKTTASLELPKLNAKVGEMIEDGRLQARQLANVLWSLAHLVDDFTEVVGIVPSIVAQIQLKAKDMNAQDAANNLWAAAKLKDDAPDVIGIVPSIVAEIPVNSKDMIPQHLSNVFWAAANLKDDAPDAIDIVPFIVAEIQVKAKDMVPQALSNVLWAAANLKDDAPDVIDIVPLIVAEIQVKAKDMKPQEVSNTLVALVPLQDLVPGVKAFLADETASTQAFVQFAASWMVKLIPRLKGPDLLLAVPSVVWACAKLEVQNQDQLAAVAKRFGSPRKISRLRAWGLCSLYGSYQMLDPRGRFSDFSEMLKKELAKRGFSDSDVGWSLEGPLEWARTNK